MTPPPEQQRIDGIAALRQFGRQFDNGVASALPSDVGQPRTDRWRRTRWSNAVLIGTDPAGPGRWCWLTTSALLPWSERMPGGSAGLLVLLLGLLVLALLRKSASAWPPGQQRLQVLGAALQSSPAGGGGAT